MADHTNFIPGQNSVHANNVKRLDQRSAIVQFNIKHKQFSQNVYLTLYLDPRQVI